MHFTKKKERKSAPIVKQLFNMNSGSKLKIKYYPKCSQKCYTTCKSCIIDTEGLATGRYWNNEKSGERLYEVTFYKNNKYISDVIPEKFLESYE